MILCVSLLALYFLMGQLIVNSDLHAPKAGRIIRTLRRNYLALKPRILSGKG
jgi:hypothetical protein